MKKEKGGIAQQIGVNVGEQIAQGEEKHDNRNRSFFT